jgi:hypothetical protein
MTNIYAALAEPEQVDVKQDLAQLVDKYGKKAVTVAWESVTQPDVIVERRIYSVVTTRQTAKGVLITVKISRRKFRSLYQDRIKAVTVD